MREDILKRIEEIRLEEDNFSRTSMKWWIFTCGKNKVHISECDFNECSDDELNSIYKRIIKTIEPKNAKI